MPLYVTATGWLAMMLCISSYLMRDHRKLTIVAAIGVLTWAAYFLLQAHWTAGVLSVVMALRVAAGLFIARMTLAQRRYATLLGWTVTAAGAMLTWQGVTSVPSTVASLFMVWAGLNLFYRQLRLALLVAEVLWFANGWVLNSNAAMVAAAVSFTINLVIVYCERPGRAIPLEGSPS